MTLSPLVLPLANAGTPLIWASFLWLVVGNAIIAMIESWMFRRVAGLKFDEKEGLFPVVLVANYASAIAGVVVMVQLTDRLPGYERLALDAPWTATLLAFAGMFAVSLLIEVPVVCLYARVRRGVVACLAGNVVTHLLCLALLLLAMTNNVNDWARQPLGVHPTLAGYRVEYTAPDGTLRQIDLGPIDTTIQPVTVENAPFSRSNPLQTREGRYEDIYYSGFVLSFVAKSGQARSFYLQTEVPFARPRTLHHTLLDDDLLLCQLGPWVMILDPNSMRMYRLAEGSKPKAYLYAPSTAK